MHLDFCCSSMSRLILLHFILSDARNPWGIKREEVHLGFCLKIQRGKHKILISIYWSFFTSILYQLKWRETSCDPGSRGIKDRKKRQRGKGEGEWWQGTEATALPPSSRRNWPEPFSRRPAPCPASLFLVPCPEVLCLASVSPLCNPLSHRLQVATRSHLGLLPCELSGKAQHAHLLPCVTSLFPERPLFRLCRIFLVVPEMTIIGSPHLFPLFPVLPLVREDESGS